MVKAKKPAARRKLTPEEEALVAAMRARVEAEEGEGEMVVVRFVPETDAKKSVALMGAIDLAAQIARRGDKLPGYLEEALLRFNESMNRAADLAMVKNAVDAAHKAGAALNRAPAQGKTETAFDIAADNLGMSSAMVESIYYGRTPNNQPYPQKTKTPKK